MDILMIFLAVYGLVIIVWGGSAAVGSALKGMAKNDVSNSKGMAQNDVSNVDEWSHEEWIKKLRAERMAREAKAIRREIERRNKKLRKEGKVK